MASPGLQADNIAFLSATRHPRTAEATPSPKAPPDPDDQNMKKLLAGRNAYEELLRAAHTSPRPSTTTHPFYHLDESEQQAHTWEKLQPMRNCTDGLLSSEASVFQDIEISLKDVMLYIAHSMRVFEEFKGLTANGKKAASTLNELLTKEKWFWCGKRPCTFSGESFTKRVEAALLKLDVEEMEVTGEGDETGTRVVGGVVDLIDGRIKAQLKHAIQDQTWLKDPDNTAALEKQQEVKAKRDQITAKVVEKSAGAGAKSERRSSVGGDEELEDRKVAAVLTAEAKRLKEQRQALKQRKKERTRKV